MSDFELDERLARDSDLMSVLGLCQLRLSKDSRWPWLLLVPQRPDVSEMFELPPTDQALLTQETNSVAVALQSATGATKINIASIGNIVRQLHVHVVARFEGDPNWPRPIWGFGAAEPYEDADRQDLINKLAEALSS